MGTDWVNLRLFHDYGREAEEAYGFLIDLEVSLAGEDEWEELKELLDEARAALDSGEGKRAAEKQEEAKKLLRDRLDAQGKLNASTEAVVDALMLPEGPYDASTAS